MLTSEVVKRLGVLLVLFGPLALLADKPEGSSILELEDRAQPFQPRLARSEEDLYQLEASALFAYGRVLSQQKKYDEALWNYQHAWQTAPGNPTVALEIVALALRLDREDTAARYASLIAEFPSSQVSQLPRIARILTRQRAFAAAARVYERMLELRADVLKGSSLLALRLELGRLYNLAEMPHQAASAFDQVGQIRSDPKKHGLSDEDVNRVIKQPQAVDSMIATAYLKANQFDKARAAYERLLRSQMDEPLHRFRLALVSEAEHDFGTAREYLDQYLESGSESAGQDAYRLLDELLSQQEKNETRRLKLLLERLQQLAAEHPDNRPLLESLADRLLASEQWSEARDVLVRLLSKRKSAAIVESLARAELGLLSSGKPTPDHLQTLLHLISVLAGSEGDFDNEVFQEIATREELVDSILRFASETLGKSDAAQDTDETQIEPFVQADPAEQALAAGSLAIAAGRPADARALFELAIELEPGKLSKWLEAWGMRLLVTDKMPEAAAIFQRATESDEIRQKQAFFFLLAGAAAVAGDEDRALAAAQEAVALVPENPSILSRLAWVSYQAEDYEEAHRGYAAVVEKFKDQYGSSDLRKLIRQNRMILSSLCVRMGRIDEAEAWLLDVLHEFPQDIGAWNDLGYLWADQNKRLQRAEQMISQAVDQEPENGAYLDSLGWVYYRLGRLDEAVEQLKKAASISADDPTVLDHLGDAYRARGQGGKAREAWKKALQLLPLEDDDLRKLIDNKLRNRSQ